MTDTPWPLLRRAAALLDRTFCNLPMRLAVIVAIVAAVASSAHAAALLH
jgi:hypothetical protein